MSDSIRILEKNAVDHLTELNRVIARLANETTMADAIRVAEICENAAKTYRLLVSLYFQAELVDIVTGD